MDAIIALLPTIIFYLFAGLLLISAATVITARNPVHAVFFLILAFFNASGLFVLLGAEYLAMALVIVYVGAVAVLFLFVVMMLDVNFVELRQGFLRYLPVGMGVAAALFAEFVLLIYYGLQARVPAVAEVSSGLAPTTNTQALGAVLYTNYIYPFQVSGLILLVAMIGAIVLTLKHRPDVRRQRISQQVDRKREDAISIVQVKSGQGI